MTVLKAIKSLFFGSKISYDIRTVKPEDCVNFPDGLMDLKTRKLDGLLFKGFLNSEELKSILKGFNELSDNEFVRTPVGGVFPMVFQQLAVQAEAHENSSEMFSEYFTISDDFQSSFEERFKVDFKGKLFNLLSAMSGQREIGIPEGYGGKGLYSFATFRRLLPNVGQMGYHTGNLFRNMYAKFYEHLDTIVSTYDQLSYFVLLQKPEKGGELTLYNLEWQDGQFKEGNRYVVSTDGRKSDMDTIESIFLDVEPGDLIVFNGAQIWHRVEHVHGNIDRITLGGFIGFSPDNSKIYLWS